MLGETTGVVRHASARGLCMLVASSVAYSKFGLCWGTFALFFLRRTFLFLVTLLAPGVDPLATT